MPKVNGLPITKTVEKLFKEHDASRSLPGRGRAQSSPKSMSLAAAGELGRSMSETMLNLWSQM